MKVLVLALSLLVSACAPPLAPTPVDTTPPVVLVPASLTVAINGTAGNQGDVLVNLSVRDATGKGVANVTVTLTTTAGTFDRPIVTTGFTGTAQSLLTTAKAATITATGAGLTTSARVSAASTAITLSANANPTNPNKGDGVSFTAAVTGGSAPYSYTWIFGDGSSGSGQTTSHRYFSDGSKSITVTVTDTDGLTGTTSTSVSVQPDPLPPAPPAPPVVPRLAAVLTCTPALHGTPTSCNVTATFGGAAIIATSITNVDWNWGDGQMDIGSAIPVMTHTYTTTGTYTAFVFVSVPLLATIPAEASKVLVIP